MGRNAVVSCQRVGLEAVGCKPAKTARALYVARVTIGTSEEGWWRVASPKRLLGYVGRCLG